jgi:hypothetical protein
VISVPASKLRIETRRIMPQAYHREVAS